MQSARVSSVRVCGLRSQEPESADKTEKKENRFSLSHFHSFVFSSLRKTRARVRQNPKPHNIIILYFTLPHFATTNNRSWNTLHKTNYDWLTMTSWFDHLCSSKLKYTFFFSFVYFTFLCVLVGCRKSSELLGSHLCYNGYAYYTDDVRANIFHFIVIDWSENSSHDHSIRTNSHTHMNLTHVFTTIAQCKYGSTVGDGRTAYSGVRSRSHRAHKISMPINNTYTTLHTTDRNQSTYKPISENFYFQRDKHNLHIFFYYYYCKFILSFIPYNCQHGILHAVTATPTLDAAVVVVVTAVDCCC